MDYSYNIYTQAHIPRTQLLSQKLRLQCHEPPPAVWKNTRLYRTSAHVLPALFLYPFYNISFFPLQLPIPVPVLRSCQEVFASFLRNIDNTFLRSMFILLHSVYTRLHQSPLVCSSSTPSNIPR